MVWNISCSWKNYIKKLIYIFKYITMNNKKIVYIYIKTWLHIGAGKDSIEIGWMDQPFIKTRNWDPYIPWSSLKWKCRTLLELNIDWKRDIDGKVHSCKNNDCVICNLFWSSGEDLDESHKPTRFIFRDIYLSEDKDLDKLENLTNDEILYTRKEYENLKNKWKKYFKEKTEVAIDRKQWTAAGSWPRPIERVPAWSLFKWELVIRKFEWDDENILKIDWKDIFIYMKELLENDYLWGQWTRGHWQVKIWFLDDNENADEQIV